MAARGCCRPRGRRRAKIRARPLRKRGSGSNHARVRRDGFVPPHPTLLPARIGGRWTLGLVQRGYTMMMDHMMGGGMMWGMGLIGLLVIIVLILAAAALVKYLFISKTKND